MLAKLRAVMGSEQCLVAPGLQRLSFHHCLRYDGDLHSIGLPRCLKYFTVTVDNRAKPFCARIKNVSKAAVKKLVTWPQRCACGTRLVFQSVTSRVFLPLTAMTLWVLSRFSESCVCSGLWGPSTAPRVSRYVAAWPWEVFWNKQFLEMAFNSVVNFVVYSSAGTQQIFLQKLSIAKQLD